MHQEPLEIRDIDDPTLIELAVTAAFDDVREWIIENHEAAR